MASSQALPEPMNSSPHHSKVKVTITLADPTFVAGAHVSGKVEMECRADSGLGIGLMMVELFAIQELSSRDHSATSTFLHSRRLFQGPGLPPSNAVQAYPMPGDPPLPLHYHQARKGRSTFLFRIPIPASSPSSITFGTGLAKVLYELRASVGVYWKNEKRLVIDKHPIDVVEAYPYEETFLGKVPEGIVVGENGKLWMQGKLVGSVIVAGGTACLELQVKNHSSKKNTGLTLSLTRTLYLPGSGLAPVQISDTLTTVPFRGSEYIIPPGAEGIANLVFDVPKHARGVKGGTLDGEESEVGLSPRRTEALFEIKCKVEVKLTMGIGSKDILLEIPVEIVHPTALPSLQEVPGPYTQNYTSADPMPGQPGPYPDYVPYYAASPVPMHIPYLDPSHNQVWLPPAPIPQPTSLGYPYSPMQHDIYSPPLQPYAVPQPYYESHYSPLAQDDFLLPPDNQFGIPAYMQRPASAGPVFSASQIPLPMIPGLPIALPQPSLLPLTHYAQQQDTMVAEQPEPEAGKGERALRVTQHLRMSSRNRSVSPQSHRYPLPAPSAQHVIDIHTQNPSSAAAYTDTSSNGLGPHNLLPPGLTRPENPSTPPASTEKAVVHSPRPQLTPKHSFTRDPVLGVMSKSERVDKLEKMADEVARKSRDLSCDLPKGIGVDMEVKEQENSGGILASEDGPNVNKTLPGPPVPSGKHLIALPSRARADLYFGNQQHVVQETLPLPSDQAPPTPTLLAVLPSRQLKVNRDEIRQESGLDALERRLLAEVGTRKYDTRHFSREQRPDVRSVLPIDTSLSPRRSVSIPIPAKSPEPLHDSAISSLTLAGGLGGDDSDGEFDGRTHRAGRSRSGSSEGREGGGTGLHMHMRERAYINIPTKTLNRERDKAKGRAEKTNQEPELFANTNERERNKEGKTSGKKDRSSNKSAAKGRVAAWLGGIDPDVPPQEQIIPPSPSVLRNPDTLFDLGDDATPHSSSAAAIPPDHGSTTTPGPEPRPRKDVDASPNPRSSGFVAISTLNRHSIDAQVLLTRDNSVLEEAKRVQNLWSSDSHPGVRETVGIVSKPQPIDPRSSNKPSMPLSYSAAARNVWKAPQAAKAKITASPLPHTKAPAMLPQKGKIQAMFPPTSHKPVDLEVKYDIRSARGGRGGKVTSVANLWSSGAITNHGVKGKGHEKRSNPVEEIKPPPPPPPKEKKLFSAAVMTPSPGRKQPPIASGSGAPPARPSGEAQKRPDSRAVFSTSRPGSEPKHFALFPALSTPSYGAVATITKNSFAAQKRPATAMAHARKPVPASLSTSEPKVRHGLSAKGAKPVIKATSDPAVVSSSHAVPTLSSTASLARPHVSAAPLFPRRVKLPTTLSTPNMAAGNAPDPPRAASPSKPADLAFGQARLRDLIKKYQGQGQRT